MHLGRPESFGRSSGEEEREALAMYLREQWSHISPKVTDSQPFRELTLWKISGSGTCEWCFGVKEELVLDQERAGKCGLEKCNQSLSRWVEWPAEAPTMLRS